MVNSLALPLYLLTMTNGLCYCRIWQNNLDGMLYANGISLTQCQLPIDTTNQILKFMFMLGMQDSIQQENFDKRNAIFWQTADKIHQYLIQL